MPTIRNLYNQGIRKICRIDEPYGRYIWCPNLALINDDKGREGFYCNLHSPDGHVINYGFKVDIDKEGYCEY